MKHDCVSCGRPGGDPRQGGLCPKCQVFGRVCDLGRRSFTAMLEITKQPE